MENFKEIIDDEDVPVCETTIDTRKIEPFPVDLQTLGLKLGWAFDQELINLELTTNQKDPTYNLEVKVDLVPRALVIDGRGDEVLTSRVSQVPQVIRKEILDILDWEDIYYRILEYKNEHEYFNLSISKENLKKIVYDKKYTLLCDPDLIEPKTFLAKEQTTDIAVLILQKYVNIYRSKKRNAAEKKHVQLKTISADSLINSYLIKLSEEDQILIEKIREFVKSGKIYSTSAKYRLTSDLKTFTTEKPIEFQNALFEGHLYQPLLIKQDSSKITTIPTGLNEGEQRFVEDLRKYIETNPMQAKIFLLRNPPKGGVGFYEIHSFYPDFILWIETEDKQTIVFIDPKGLAHMGIDDPKLKLHKFLKEELEKELDNSEC